MSGKSGLGGASGGAGACGICRKKGHEGVKCPKRLGCAKCGVPTEHAAESCTKDYPPHDQQGCDFCFDSAHEFKDSKKKKCGAFKFKPRFLEEYPCGFCGHGDHAQTDPPCPLAKLYETNTDSALDQMTPWYRKKLADKAASKAAKAAKP